MNAEKYNDNFDVNQEVTNPLLLEMLQRLEATTPNDKETISKILDKIAKEFAFHAKLLSIVQINGLKVAPTGQITLKEETEFSFLFFKNKDGQSFLPLFTDWEEIRKNEEYKNSFVRTMTLSFDDYYTLVKDNNAGIVINPFSTNLIISNSNIQHIKERKDTELNDKLVDRCRYGSAEEVKELLKQGADVNFANQFKSVLMLAVQKNQPKIVKLLIDAGADVNFVNQFKESILMVAVNQNQPEIVKLLIDAGADVNYKDNFGESISQIAEQKGFTEIIDILKSNESKN